ncbi:thioredoxin fold domain-containing protein [Gilvimarinus sp. SDUM040013]|uniref:Thiol:disulfide interchange protein n=1 Tax=Gilvimarinus gilvus TaxID=3058038 RepID=A0ABU4RTA9_9GAMM|nr:thioredoxin fold domain-containing protein [Gilvimarinus sp. SDUM040013]MDO3387001.1 thioredoxin fold domain-containing protein [Gilvimarinus sp. SDUM040013]MDX6848105.1 thioredoxin fold domain-containing protein [Gilvimarinus sp. SDUM040013]
MWIKRLRFSFMACALASVATIAQAQEATESTPEEAISAALKQIVGDAQLGPIRPSVVDGLYTVQVVGGPTLMVTPDGKYAVMGDTYEITPGGLAAVQDPYLQNARKEFLANLEVTESINFAPEEGAKHVAYVFTDVDCGYCRRLHSQLHEYRERGELKPGYNDLGIEIRYLAYPRAGANSPSAAKLESAWCADNQQEALDKLKSLQEVEPKSCEASPVARQYVKGGELGVNATPAILLPDGRFFLGYLPPERLLNTITEGE